VNFNKSNNSTHRMEEKKKKELAEKAVLDLINRKKS
jgi:hypothetical protein